jgi:hypothetical protein
MRILDIIEKIRLNIKAYILILLKSHKKNYSENLIGIIFSKDRPLQLYALLESYFIYCKNPMSLIILYKASEENYEKAYNEIKDLFKNQKITFRKEISFKSDLIHLLETTSSKFIFFLVDDIIFTKHFVFDDFISLKDNNKYILSLRLGENLNYCYTKQSKQPLPSFNKKKNFLVWKWRKEKLDWNYVFSVDGNIYNKDEILIIAKMINFRAPNSFEAGINTFRFILRRKKGICYQESKLVNVCLNKVQNEIKNISGNISTNELLQYWNEGKKIDINYFNNMMNNSAHIQIDDLPLKNR